MSNIVPGVGVRDIYVKDSGDNDNSGANVLRPVSDLPTASLRSSELSPPPGLTSPASIVDSGASLYVLDQTYTISDNVQSALRFSSIATDPVQWVVPGTLINGGANSQASFLTISTSPLSGDVAYSTNGKSRQALSARAIILNGPDQIGSSIDGATDDSFMDIGQALARYSGGKILSITSTGNKPRYYQYNEMNVESDNCTGFHCDTPSTGTAAFRVGALTYETSLIPGNGTGAGCIGFDVVRGFLAGYCVEANIETIADVGVNGDLILDNLTGTGNINVDGKKNYSARRLTGNVSISSTGDAVINIDEHTGDFQNSGEASYRAIKVNGNITLESGSDTVINIDKLTGTFTPVAGAVYGGVINGIEVGTWVEGNELSNSYTLPGGVPGSASFMGRLEIDTATTTIDPANLIARFSQTNWLSHTVEFRILDADNLGTVFFSGSTTTSAVDFNTVVSMSTVTALPVSQVVTLYIEVERTTGAFFGASDASIQIGYTTI